MVAGTASVFFAGDTDLFDEMSGLVPKLDLALLPIWGWGPTIGPGHLDPGRAAEALTLLAPRLAVPIHWGTLRPAYHSARATFCTIRSTSSSPPPRASLPRSASTCSSRAARSSCRDEFGLHGGQMHHGPGNRRLGREPAARGDRDRRRPGALALLAGRDGVRLELGGVSPALRELIDLAGLAFVLLAFVATSPWCFRHQSEG